MHTCAVKPECTLTRLPYSIPPFIKLTRRILVEADLLRDQLRCKTWPIGVELRSVCLGCGSERAPESLSFCSGEPFTCNHGGWCGTKCCSGGLRGVEVAGDILLSPALSQSVACDCYCKTVYVCGTFWNTRATGVIYVKAINRSRCALPTQNVDVKAC